LAEKYGEAQETIEELSATAAEEIDRRQQDIDSLNAALCDKTSSLANTSKRLQVIIRVCMLLMDGRLPHISFTGFKSFVRHTCSSALGTGGSKVRWFAEW
jgi:hypothetical protein